jgi:hypothetical protein
LEARLDELDRILKSPFEFADKLSGLLREQEEINAMLDLDKDQAGALDGEAMPAEGEDPVAPARDDEEELVA